jgi:transaldolase
MQRPLWASTSVKNPKYDPLLYVNSLLLPCTVNTMPISTLQLAHQAKLEDWKLPQETFVLEAHRVLAAVEATGIDMRKVTIALEKDGIKKFSDSYDQIIQSITKRI